MNHTTLKLRITGIKQIFTLALLTTCVHLGAMDKIKLNQQLLQATENGNTQQVEQYIKAGADVNTTSKSSHTPLHHAAHNGNTKIAKLLLDAKAEVNTPSKYGRTPFYIAVKQQNRKTAQLLIDAKADVNKSDSSQLSPLYHAAFNALFDNGKMLLLLLNAGAKIDTKDMQTTLENCVTYYDANLIYVLLRKYNPSEEVLKHAFLQIKDKTDNKSMLIKTMLMYWDNIQKRIAKTNDPKEKKKLRRKFDYMILEASIKYNQSAFYVLDQEPGKRKEFFLHHLAQICAKKETKPVAKLSNKPQK